MPWRFWPWKAASVRGKSTDDGPRGGDELLGVKTAADVAWLDAFVSEHRSELLSLVAERGVESAANLAASDALPDFGWPYEADGFVGEGATGKVFEATDREFSRRVAIKISHFGSGDEESRVYQALLAREQRQLGPLEHDHVVRVYRSGRLADGRLWYAMEFVDGEPLTHYGRSGHLNLRRTIALMEVVASAVGWLHQRGIIHADLKPGHILVNEHGKPKVIDFGMSRVIGRSSGSLLVPAPGSSTGSCVGGGTPGYRAPEIAGGQRGDLRADVYSLGVILHELLTSKLPEQPHDASAVASLNGTSGADGIAPVRRRIPPELDAIVQKCLSEESEERYADATQLADELASWLEDRPVGAFEKDLPRSRFVVYRVAKFVRRHRVAAAIIGLSACLVLTGIGFALNVSSTTAMHETMIAAETAERQRSADARRRADAEQDRVETEQHRSAFQSARELLAQGRVDDARRALAKVPFSRRGLECDILSRRLAEFPTRQRVIGTHDWGVIAILASPECIISAGHDGRLRVWEPASGDCRTLRDGQWSQAMRRYTRVLEATENQGNYPDVVVSVAWLEPGKSFVSASLSGIGTVWTLDDGRPRELIHHDCPLLVVATSIDERNIVFGDDHGAIIACREDGSEMWRSEVAGGSAITAIAPARRRGWWIGQADGVVRLVDAQMGTEICRTIVDGPVWQLAPTPDDREVAIACQRAGVVVYVFDDAERMLREKNTITLPNAEQGPPRAVHAIAYSPSGDRLYLVDDLGRLVGLNARDGSVDFIRDDQGVSPLPAAEVGGWPWPLRRRSAGITFLDDGRTLVTAGHDTLIKAWQLEPPPWASELDAGGVPLLAFDSLNDTLLWVATSGGRLLLVDAQTARQRDAVDSGTAQIDAIAVAARVGRVATAGQQSIRIWREVDGKVQSMHRPILCGADVRSLALSPDGGQIAAYLESGSLQLWDVSSGRPLAARSLPAINPDTIGGRIAFNASGTRLGVLSQKHSVFILDGQNLSTLDQPAMVAGQGGTALVWHPRDHETLFAGDTIGRLARHPGMDSPVFLQPDDWTEHAPVVDLAVSPDGGRVLAGTPSGRIVVIDPVRLGALLSFNIPNSGGASPVTSMVLNKTGRLLAAGRRDGTVSILRVADADVPRPQSTRAWSESLCCQAAEAANVRLRPSSVAVDRQGFVHVLYLRTQPAPAGADRKWQLILGRETPSGWREHIVREFSRLSYRAVDAVQRSLCLAINEDRWQGLAKLDAVSGGEQITGLYLLGGLITQMSDASEKIELIVAQPNDGFDPVFVTQNGAWPAVLHFAHAGHYLLLTRRTGEQWITSPVGRQGDGYRMHAASGDGSGIHLLFQPTRFNGDRSPPVCLSASLDGKDERRSASGRSRFTNVFGGTPLGITVSPSAEPIVLYRVATPDGQTKLLLARRKGDDWLHQTIFDREPLPLFVSNLVSDSNGTVFFAVNLNTDGQVWFVTVQDGPPKIERVWQDTGSPVGTAELQMKSMVHLGPTGAPVVVVVRDSPHAGYIRVFRSRDSAGGNVATP